MNGVEQGSVLDFSDMPEATPGATLVIEEVDKILDDGARIRKIGTWLALAVADGLAASGLAVSIAENLPR
jgi:hypothetical protein